MGENVFNNINHINIQSNSFNCPDINNNPGQNIVYQPVDIPSYDYFGYLHGEGAKSVSSETVEDSPLSNGSSDNSPTAFSGYGRSRKRSRLDTLDTGLDDDLLLQEGVVKLPRKKLLQLSSEEHEAYVEKLLKIRKLTKEEK